MAIIWIIATFVACLGIAWFLIMLLFTFPTSRSEPVAPSIIAAIGLLVSAAGAFHSAEQVEAQYHKIMETRATEN